MAFANSLDQVSLLIALWLAGDSTVSLGGLQVSLLVVLYLAREFPDFLVAGRYGY